MPVVQGSLARTLVGQQANAHARKRRAEERRGMGPGVLGGSDGETSEDGEHTRVRARDAGSYM